MSDDGFRLQAKNFFLTWPQCDEPKELALECIIQQFGDDLDYAVVAEEDHKDGTPHLHAILALKEKLRIRSSTWFDFITGKHGNYQTQRSPVANMQYVVKGCRYVQVGINVVDFLNAHGKKTNTKATRVAQMIVEGSTLADLLEQEPGFVLANKRKIEDLVSWVSQKRFRSSMGDEFKRGFGFRPWQQQVIKKLNEQTNRQVLWVWDSVGKTGKNTLTRYILTHYRAFLSVGGKSEDIAHAFRSSSDIQVAVFNFTRDKQSFINYSVLENFKDGNLFSPKYESSMLFFKPCKVIVFANFEPEMDKLSIDRWDIYEVKH